VKAAEERSADFGVSDTPLSDVDATRVGSIRHLPLAVEAIAMVYALQGVTGRLQVTEDVLSDMLTGSIRWWDDAALVTVNPGVKLPHVQIQVVYREDESGSSYLLSEWLKKTSKHWPLGASRSLKVPGFGAQKDDGMIARMRGNDGSLGYVSAVTAFEQHLSTFAVRNPAGRFVSPSLDGMRAAAASAQLGADDLLVHVRAAPRR
jgi:phosphate transport system substrate-binding protein